MIFNLFSVVKILLCMETLKVQQAFFDSHPLQWISLELTWNQKPHNKALTTATTEAMNSA